MKNSNVKFSLSLLRVNLKHHKRNIRLNKYTKHFERTLSKEHRKKYERRMNETKRYIEDLTTAIAILSGKNKNKK